MFCVATAHYGSTGMTPSAIELFAGNMPVRVKQRALLDDICSDHMRFLWYLGTVKANKIEVVGENKRARIDHDIGKMLKETVTRDMKG